MEKRGLSEVVAVSLLVALGVTLVIILFAWSRSYMTNLSPPVGIQCQAVNFDAEIYGTSLAVINKGPDSIGGFTVKSVSAGSSEIKDQFQSELEPGRTASFPLLLATINSELLIVPRISVNENATLVDCPDEFGLSLRY